MSNNDKKQTEESLEVRFDSWLRTEMRQFIKEELEKRSKRKENESPSLTKEKQNE
jgi:hypothetical protein